VQKPVIELRKISYNSRLSEETSAYAAQIWVDGVHFCDVSNHGTGGSDMHQPPRGSTGNQMYRRLEELNERIAATFPKAHGEFDPDIESVCRDLLSAWLIERDVKRDLSRKIVFVKPADGRLYTVRKPADGAQAVKLLAAVKAKHGIAHTLNEMAFDEAVKIYAAAARI
jgi:hypothetical protein